MAPKRVEDSTGEVEHKTSQDSNNAELQVPRLVQLPGTADRPALSHGKAELDFNFRLAGGEFQRATAAPPDFSGGNTALTAF